MASAWLKQLCKGKWARRSADRRRARRWRSVRLGIKALEVREMLSAELSPGQPGSGPSAGPPAAYFTVSAARTATVHTPFRVRVTARGSDGSPASGYSGAVTLSSSDAQAVASGSVWLANGSATVALTPRHSGTVAFTASAGTLRGSSNSINVGPSLYTWTIHLSGIWARLDGQVINLEALYSTTASDTWTAQENLALEWREYLEEKYGDAWQGTMTGDILSCAPAN
jgi:hypothetical protein